jgi:hypothetical protein
MDENQINNEDNKQKHKDTTDKREKDSSAKKENENQEKSDLDNIQNHQEIQEPDNFEPKEENTGNDNVAYSEEVIPFETETDSETNFVLEPDNSISEQTDNYSEMIPEESISSDNILPPDKDIEEKTMEIQKESAGIIHSEKIKIETVEGKNEESIPLNTKESNFQISLVDENLLKVKVITEKAVNLDCSVKEKSFALDATGEKQTNYIYVHPKGNRQSQEIEIIVYIGSTKSETEISEPQKEELVTTEEQKQSEFSSLNPKESNYQISLVTENLLKVKVITEKAVNLDCSVKEKSSVSGATGKKQTNKIYIHPKEDKQSQEIEFKVAIGRPKSEIRKFEPSFEEERTGIPEKPKLTPNPIVADLIQKFGNREQYEYIPKTPEEKLEERIGPRNPWVMNRLFMRKNLTRGFTGAIIIYLIFVGFFYKMAGKNNNNNDVVETQRLIVMQDLPEQQNLLQHIEDPNKPPEEKKPVEDDNGTDTKTIPPLIPKKINKPPRIIGPERVKTDTTSLTTKTDKELDSLRNANFNNSGKGIDTSKFSVYAIPDSLKKDFTQNDVGLIIGAIPKNWKIIDSRMININQKDFEGVLITDTTAKKEGTLNLFIHLDAEGKEFTKEGFKTEFKMNDTTSSAFVKEPLTQAKNTYYRFYIFSKTDKLYVDAQVKEEFFNEYKNNIEALVRSIKISRPEKK